jgi:type IV secretory pathway VirB4 component
MFYAATAGGAPYRFHCHVETSDTPSVVGPTGAGKTSLIALATAHDVGSALWNAPDLQFR